MSRDVARKKLADAATALLVVKTRLQEAAEQMALDSNTSVRLDAETLYLTAGEFLQMHAELRGIMHALDAPPPAVLDTICEDCG